MPTELIKEFIGKECIITLLSEKSPKIIGKVLGAEGYWIKVQEQDSERLVNGAIVRDIKVITK